MADKGMTLAIVLLVAGLIVGGGVGYFAAPTKTETVSTTTVVKEIPLKNTLVKLGYIASSTSGLETGKPWHESIMQPRMNAYSAILGYGTTWQYQIDDAQGQPNTHLEKVQGYKSAGITVFEGGGWSSQAQGSLQYVNSNGMLMWSTSSTSPTLAIANDRLYRMCTNDAALSPALADAMWQFGVKTAILFQRGDSWGDGIVNLFIPAFEKLGGKIGGEKIRYAAEATEFANYLDVANQQVNTALAQYNGDHNRVAVVILSFDEIPVICKQAASYDGIYNVHWWGSDGTAKSTRAMNDSPNEANHIGIYSFLSRQVMTPLYAELDKQYFDLTKVQFSSYTAYGYDIAITIVSTMQMAQSQKADDIVALQAPFCNEYYGAAGWSKLIDAGDRAPPPYDIWGFYPGNTTGSEQPNAASTSIIMAQYDPDFRVTTWKPEVLGYTPPGP